MMNVEDDMDDPDAEFMDTVEAYVDRFGDGPDIFEMDEDEAVRRMRLAIESGEPIDMSEA